MWEMTYSWSSVTRVALTRYPAQLLSRLYCLVVLATKLCKTRTRAFTYCSNSSPSPVAWACASDMMIMFAACSICVLCEPVFPVALGYVPISHGIERVRRMLMRRKGKADQDPAQRMRTRSCSSYYSGNPTVAEVKIREDLAKGKYRQAWRRTAHQLHLS